MQFSIRSLLKEYHLKSLTKNKRVKQVSALYGSLFLTLLIGVGISVINTRLLGPKQYGDFRFIMNLFNFIAPFLTLGIFVSGARLIAQKKHESIKYQLMGSLFFLALVMSVVLMTAIFVFSFFEDHIFQNELGWILRVFVPFLLIFPLQKCLENVMQGDNKIYELSVFRIGPSVIYIIGMMLFNYFIPMSLIPALALRLTSFAVVIVAVIFILKPKFKNFKDTISIIWQENRGYGFHVYIGIIAGVASVRLGGLSIGYFLDTTQVGFFALASTVSTPLIMIPNAVGTTFFKSFVERKEIPSKVVVFTVLLAVCALAGFTLIIKPVFSLLYPMEFNPALSLVYLIAFAHVVHGFGDFFNRFLGAHGKGKELRNGAIVVGLINFSGYILLVYLLGVKGAAITMIISGSTYLLMMLFYYINYRRKLQ
jgi:O-antigen/teichoic acid export membrane protein